ncbi:ECF transporter S component [Streptomyces cacaoi]|uniref:ECF transporter S component n=1 Tax=Streptomyces cacaoi TaxID=1898 RepID=UPI000A36C673|nr:ECF transporter S component [Streptomyces cacaoi]NNG88204.1 hypothetical protein [Streptomyces cacaoi]
MAPPVPFTTRTSMTCVAVGAAFGIVLIPANILANATASMPVLVSLFYGLWVLPALVAVALLPRFGTGVLAATVAGLVAGFGSGYGPFMIVMMALWGLLLELPFLLTRYRRLGTGTFLLSGLLIGVVSGVWTAGFIGFGQLAAGVLAAVLATALASSVVFAWFSVLLGGKLSRSGIGTAVRTGAASTAASAPATPGTGPEAGGR